MGQQIPLPLHLSQHTRLTDYIVGDNHGLLALLQQQREQSTQPLIYLTGAPGTGRTHLLLGQCHAAQAQGLRVAYLPVKQLLNSPPTVLENLQRLDLLAVDDLQCIAGHTAWESALFNLFNQARDQACQLLFSAAEAASVMPFNLPDLRSRLSWGVTYRLKPLTDPQREQLLCQLAHRHGLTLADNVCRYLIQHYTRETTELVRLINQLNQASLVAKRPLTLPFIRQLLRP